MKTALAKHTPAKRSDRTRARILTAARARFSSDGYERTTIRAVAEDAEIDPSMVMRYFGSKEGLFAAAADFALHLPDLTDVRRGHIGEALVSHFFHRWESGDDSLQILLRTAVSNDDAAERARSVVREQIAPVVAKLRGKKESQRIATLIATQMLGLAYCLYILRLPGLLALSRETLVSTIGATIQRYLDS